jgi:hypothetical protein
MIDVLVKAQALLLPQRGVEKAYSDRDQMKTYACVQLWAHHGPECLIPINQPPKENCSMFRQSNAMPAILRSTLSTARICLPVRIHLYLQKERMAGITEP